jgi:hypothetical protein
MAPGFNPWFVIVLLTTFTIFYVIPSIFAYGLKHKHRANIAIVNMLAGWTIIGWIACLCYVIMSDPGGELQ